MAANNNHSIEHQFQFDDYVIFTSINEWERHSIGKIQLAAQQARNDLRQLFNKKHEDFVYLLTQINKQIESNLTADINLTKWTEELTKLRQNLSNLSSYVHLKHDESKPPIYLIKLSPTTNDRIDQDTVIIKLLFSLIIQILFNRMKKISMYLELNY
jgi:hypothetical protein